MVTEKFRFASRRPVRIVLLLSLGLGLGAISAWIWHTPWARAARSPFVESASPDQGSRTPVIVELFTSEGCSSCPAADELMSDLVETQPVDGASIIPLGFHVDYWNDLGWKDRFSHPAFTARQRAYAHSFNSRRVYTPQMIVNGVQEFVGSDWAHAIRSIRKAAKRASLPIELSVRDSLQDSDNSETAATFIDVDIGVSGLEMLRPGEVGDVVLAVTEDHLTSDVERGENWGRSLTHSAVVRKIERVGKIKSGTSPSEFRQRLLLEHDWKMENLTVIAFVQLHDDFTIVGAARTAAL